MTVFSLRQAIGSFSSPGSLGWILPAFPLSIPPSTPGTYMPEKEDSDGNLKNIIGKVSQRKQVEVESRKQVPFANKHADSENQSNCVLLSGSST